MTAAPASLSGLLEQHAQAALHISRADQTAWNGRIVEAGDGILGLAHWDGTLHLDREGILDPLHEMYSRSGRPQSIQSLLQYREALVTLLHEQSHFLSPTGSTQEAAREAFKLPGGRHLEEGIAEAWAHDHLNEYIRHLGIDKVAPGITKVHTEPSYAAYVPAVRLLTADLDRQAGLPPGESLHQLNRQTAEGQWPAVVDLIYTSSRLPQVVPPDLSPTIRLHLDSALRSSFQALEPYEPFPRGFAAARSHTAGTRILTLLHEELATAEKHYATPALTPTRQRPTLTPAQPQRPLATPREPQSATLTYSSLHAEDPAHPRQPHHTENPLPASQPHHSEEPLHSRQPQPAAHHTLSPRTQATLSPTTQATLSPAAQATIHQALSGVAPPTHASPQTPTTARLNPKPPARTNDLSR